MATAVKANDKLSFTSLIRFNKIMGTLHLIQGSLMMIFALFIYPNLISGARERGHSRFLWLGII